MACVNQHVCLESAPRNERRPGVFQPLIEPEAELIRSARRNPTAFGELYDRHVDRIYSYVYHRVGNAADAEDLTARTFHRALVGLDRYVDHGAPFSAWLYRIAHNLVANWHRDEARRATVPLEGLDAEPMAVLEAVDGPATALRASVAAAVRGLEPDRQALLVMKVQGLSNAEIAESLGRSEGAIKSLYHRTLADLRDRLDAAEPTVGTAGGRSP
jgi:RNA polymerase sigma-70 factor (ECF subfamily)